MISSWSETNHYKFEVAEGRLKNRNRILSFHGHISEKLTYNLNPSVDSKHGCKVAVRLSFSPQKYYDSSLHIGAPRPVLEELIYNLQSIRRLQARGGCEAAIRLSFSIQVSMSDRAWVSSSWSETNHCKSEVGEDRLNDRHSIFPFRDTSRRNWYTVFNSPVNSKHGSKTAVRLSFSPHKYYSRFFISEPNCFARGIRTMELELIEPRAMWMR